MPSPSLTTMSIDENAALHPDPDRAVVAIAPPAAGEGHWAGAPSAVAADGLIYLAYRLRRPVAGTPSWPPARRTVSASRR